MTQGLNTRSFFQRWHELYAASNPDHRQESWEVNGVHWEKERHIFWAAGYSFQLEVHRLAHRLGPKIDWQLLVVVECWWGPDRSNAVRNTSWCKLLAGRADGVLAWLRQPLPDDRPVRLGR